MKYLCLDNILNLCVVFDSHQANSLTATDLSSLDGDRYVISIDEADMINIV